VDDPAQRARVVVDDDALLVLGLLRAGS
jgi:hypothetical protein